MKEWKSRPKRYWIVGATVWQREGFKKCNLLIDGGKIEIVTETYPSDGEETAVFDATGLYILPGFVDLHVHFREPGFSYKETIKTGSLAGAAGGFTEVCTMPNLKPAPDSEENLKVQLDIIKKDAFINVVPFATITRQRIGNEPVEYEKLAPYVAGFSDDGSGVQDENVMREAMKGIARTGKILAAHCEVDSLLNGGYIHDGEYARKNGHKGICSESEWREVERDIKLAEETGCKLHICHVSTKESVDLVRKAKQKGIKVTCETGPHYLAFYDEELKDEGRFKMNPPIRSKDDRDALRQGVIDGTIDVIATDHAPHSEQEKSKGLEKSAMGVVGLETAFAAVYTTMVKSGLMTFERLVEIMCLSPRKILENAEPELICAGAPADLAIVDIETLAKVSPEDFKSKGKATPFEGMELTGKVIATVKDGDFVFGNLKNAKERDLYEIIENKKLNHKTCYLRLKGSTASIDCPGQFVNVAIPGKYLRRPISISDYSHDTNEIILLYDVVGEGTKELSLMEPGDKLDILTGLGTGFSLPDNIRQPLLLGGGIGCAPLVKLAVELKRKGLEPIVIAGFNTKDDDFGFEELLQERGIKCFIATVDGSKGTKGFVTDVITEKDIDADYFYACGPMPMLRALCLSLPFDGEVSLESRMGCGFGICMCCSLETKNGPKRICKEGPVFRKEDLIWK